MKKSRVFVDGALIGLVEDPASLVQEIRRTRRTGGVSTEINASYKPYNGDVIVHTDRGRARRPLIVVENGRPLLTNEDLERLERKETDFAELIQRGLVEFIDAEEEEDLFIAINEGKWNKLSEADRKAIMSVSGEKLSRLWGQRFDAQNKAGEAKLRAVRTDDKIHAVVVASRKPASFMAGADIKMIQTIKAKVAGTTSERRRLSAIFHSPSVSMP